MIARLALIASTALVALCAPAYAADESWGDGIEVMQDEEMTGLRGGVDIPGIHINFGAIVTTFVNNMPVLTTVLTVTDAGAIVQDTLGGLGQSIDEMTPEARDALGLGNLDGASGVVISDADGVTALVHNVTEGALQNIIINNASGRDLRQEIDVTLTLPGFAAMQDSLTAERIGIRIDEDMRGVVFGSAGD